MSINEYLTSLLTEKLGGDRSRFEELWTSVPDFASVLRSFDADNAWLHWRTKTVDGWYCLPADDGEFEVYFQERGYKEPGRRFSSERAAIRFALSASVFSID